MGKGDSRVAVIALTSGKGSPGATTAALAMTLAWPLITGSEGPASSPPVGPPRAAGPGARTSGPVAVVVVDADPAGCGTSPGFLRGAVPEGVGLTGLLTSTDKANAQVDLLAAAVALDETQRRLLVPGSADATGIAPLPPVWPLLSQTVAQTASDVVDVLVDVGRLGSAGSLVPLLETAEVIVVVARSSLASVAGARSAIHQLSQLPGRRGTASLLQVLLVGPGRPHSVREIERSLGVPVAATLAWDATSAEVLSDGAPAGWVFWRSPLMRSARAAAARLKALATSGSVLAEGASATVADETAAAVRFSGDRRAQVRSVSGDQRASATSGVSDE